MRLRFNILLIFGLLTLLSASAFAQDPAAFAHFDRAKSAYEEERYEDAILALEQAWRAEEAPEFLYWRVMTLQAMGEHAHALELITENREILTNAPQGGELHLLEERSRRALEEKNKVIEPPPQPPPIKAERTTLNTVGPIVLGVVGLGLGALSIPFWSRTCERESGTTCLEYAEAQTPLAVGLVSAGVLAIGGGVVWWVMGSPKEQESTAIVVSPGAIGGRF